MTRCRPLYMLAGLAAFLDIVALRDLCAAYVAWHVRQAADAYDAAVTSMEAVRNGVPRGTRTPTAAVRSWFGRRGDYTDAELRALLRKFEWCRHVNYRDVAERCDAAAAETGDASFQLTEAPAPGRTTALPRIAPSPAAWKQWLRSPMAMSVLAAVAFEDMAPVKFKTIPTPAMAFVVLAMCGVRRLDVACCPDEATRVRRTWGTGRIHDDGTEHDIDFDWAKNPVRMLRLISAADAELYLYFAPVNVSHLRLHQMPAKARGATLRALCDALDANPCHDFMEGLATCRYNVRFDGVGAADEPFNVGAAGAGALLAATGGLRHLRSLDMEGAGALLLANATRGTLQRLGVTGADTATKIDLSAFTQLRTIARNFGAGCYDLTELLLPPSVTAIGCHVLCHLWGYHAALDLRHLTRLTHIGTNFAVHSQVTSVLLPDSVEVVGDGFCPAAAAQTKRPAFKRPKDR
jgi:hypothetical protein